MGKCHLQVPEEESEDQADAEAHEPGDKHERGAFDVGKVTKDGHPFRDLAGRLGENFALSKKRNISEYWIRQSKQIVQLLFREDFSKRR